jgi:predicted  nucleic acid-binding Zn-ribbon protein
VSRVSALFRLQEIDLEGDNLNVRLDEIRAILQDSSEFESLKRAFEEASDLLRAAEAEARSAQHTVQSQRTKIEETETKLYGGQVHNPKELQDLQLEAESLKRYLETLEDRYLEAMLAQDEVAQKHSQAERGLRDFESELEATQESLTSERSQIEARLHDLTDEREAALGSVTSEDQSVYVQLRERLSGEAVAVLREDSCSACGLTVSAATQQTIRLGNQLVRCDQCRRVLYGG